MSDVGSAWGPEINASAVPSESAEKAFDDDFVQENENYQPLPDSEEYLQTLESKLKKIQKTSLTKSLSERRADEARRLLDSQAQQVQVENELLDDAQVPENLVLRRICPQKQAICESELQKLIEKKQENRDVE